MQLIIPPTGVVSAGHESLAATQADVAKGKELPNELPFLQWVQIFQQYIENEADGRYKVNTEGVPAGDYLDAANVSCAVNNALRKNQRATGEFVADVAMQAANADQAHWSTYWWGGSLYMNHALIQDISQYTSVPSKIAPLIVLAVGATTPPGWVISAILASVALIVQWLLAADNHCGGKGAILQFPWVTPPFVRQVC